MLVAETGIHKIRSLMSYKALLCWTTGSTLRFSLF